MKTLCLLIHMKDVVPADVTLPVAETGDLLDRLHQAGQGPHLLRVSANEVAILKQLLGVVPLELVLIAGLITDVVDPVWRLETRNLTSITTTELSTYVANKLGTTPSLEDPADDSDDPLA